MCANEPWQEDVLTRPMSLVAESKRRLYTPPWIKFDARIFSKRNSRSISFCAEFPLPFGRREGIGKNGEEKDERPWWPPKECRKEADQDIPITKKRKKRTNEQTNEGKGVGREKKEKRKKIQGRRRRRNSTVDGERPCRRSLVHSSSSSSFSFFSSSGPPPPVPPAREHPNLLLLPHKRQRVTCGQNQLLDQRSLRRPTPPSQSLDFLPFDFSRVDHFVRLFKRRQDKNVPLELPLPFPLVDCRLVHFSESAATDRRGRHSNLGAAQTRRKGNNWF
jgi:hypothetical protein